MLLFSVVQSSVWMGKQHKRRSIHAARSFIWSIDPGAVEEELKCRSSSSASSNMSIHLFRGDTIVFIKNTLPEERCETKSTTCYNIRGTSETYYIIHTWCSSSSSASSLPCEASSFSPSSTSTHILLNSQPLARELK